MQRLQSAGFEVIDCHFHDTFKIHAVVSAKTFLIEKKSLVRFEYPSDLIRAV